MYFPKGSTARTPSTPSTRPRRSWARPRPSPSARKAEAVRTGPTAGRTTAPPQRHTEEEKKTHPKTISLKKSIFPPSFGFDRKTYLLLRICLLRTVRVFWKRRKARVSEIASVLTTSLSHQNGNTAYSRACNNTPPHFFFELSSIFREGGENSFINVAARKTKIAKEKILYLLSYSIVRLELVQKNHTLLDVRYYYRLFAVSWLTFEKKDKNDFLIPLCWSMCALLDSCTKQNVKYDSMNCFCIKIIRKIYDLLLTKKPRLHSFDGMLVFWLGSIFKVWSGTSGCSRSESPPSPSPNAESYDANTIPYISQTLLFKLKYEKNFFTWRPVPLLWSPCHRTASLPGSPSGQRRRRLSLQRRRPRLRMSPGWGWASRTAPPRGRWWTGNW